ncbi:MAG: iron ABC transporter permease [Bacteroidales bacterium]|nr:iron ABC transporter permease [Bacteroidales bacterium]
MNCKRNIYIWCGGVLILVLLAVCDLACGGEAGAQVLLHLRAPRAVTALLAGAALALAGGQMQSVLRNPLADPHIMGVSSGAALGAAFATMLGWRTQSMVSEVLQGFTIAGAAFIGAVATSIIILGVSRKFKTASALLIFGVMLGYMVNAIVSILQFSSDSESLKMFYSWSAGSFSNSGWNEIGIMSAVLLAGLVLAVRNIKGLDIILFGDEFATMAGAPVHKIRIRAIFSCCLTTAAVTAFCGPLGFVGIVAPHIARGIFKTSSHKIIIPASLLTGSVTALAADLLSRATISPLPVASTMAIVGVPVIIYILLKGKGYGE